MIIKFFLLIIVILILFLSLRIISNFTTSVSEVEPEIQKLHDILSDQSNNLHILTDDRMELQQRINTIAKEVYGIPTTTAS
jgi:cell division protein FtsL